MVPAARYERSRHASARRASSAGRGCDPGEQPVEVPRGLLPAGPGGHLSFAVEQHEEGEAGEPEGARRAPWGSSASTGAGQPASRSQAEGG